MSKRYYKPDRMQGWGAVWSDDYAMPNEEKREIRKILKDMVDLDFDRFIAEIESAIEINQLYRNNKTPEMPFVADEVKAIRSKAIALKETLDMCHQQSVDYALQGYILAGGDAMLFPEKLSQELSALIDGCGKQLPYLKGTKSNTLDNSLGLDLAEAFKKWVPDNKVSKSSKSVFVKILDVILPIAGSNKASTTVAAAVVRRLKSN